ncbi:MAG: hypothetical protein DRJ42_24740 [Deltaproteobacteria bacterium]|nr:MAG: hypothetical protein DRJ42_24740 [Deltaproteobacteria bacterium]
MAISHGRQLPNGRTRLEQVDGQDALQQELFIPVTIHIHDSLPGHHMETRERSSRLRRGFPPGASRRTPSNNPDPHLRLARAVHSHEVVSTASRPLE